VGFGKAAYRPFLLEIGQPLISARGHAADLQTAGNFGFADSGAVQLQWVAERVSNANPPGPRP
jgi:hypothetical protein